MNKKQKNYWALSVGVAAMCGFSASAHALTLEDFGLSPTESGRLQGQLYSPGASPGVAFGSPIGFGTGYTEFFAGVGGQTMPEGAPDAVDGSMSLGLGIGDPTRWVALEASTTIISVTDDFGHDGNFNLKLHHALPGRIGVAIGIENTGRWGDADVTEASNYFAITKAFEVAPADSTVPMSLSLNAGVGDGRFAKPGDNGVGGFGSAAVTFYRRFSVIADWTGRDLNAGVSVLPFKRIPLVVTLGMINFGERYSAEREFAGGVGYTFRL